MRGQEVMEGGRRGGRKDGQEPNEPEMFLFVCFCMFYF